MDYESFLRKQITKLNLNDQELENPMKIDDKNINLKGVSRNESINESRRQSQQPSHGQSGRPSPNILMSPPASQFSSKILSSNDNSKYEMSSAARRNLMSSEKF